MTQTKSTVIPTSKKHSIYLFLMSIILLVGITPIISAQNTSNLTYGTPITGDQSELAQLLYEREQAKFNLAETKSRNIGELNQELKDTMIGRNNNLRVMFINPKVNLENKGRATTWRLQFFDEYRKTIRQNKDLTSQGLMNARSDFVRNK